MGMPARLRPSVLLLQLVGWMPWTISKAFAHVSVWFMWLANKRARPITTINIAICFPELSREDQEALIKASLFETSMNAIDMVRCWVRSRESLEGRIQSVDGLEHLDAAVAAGKGTLLLVPHLGSWEIVSLYVASRHNVTALYREPRATAIAGYIHRQRERQGIKLMPIGTAGLRGILQALRANEMALLLPDQVPPRENGQFAPFFGEPTMTMTLGSSLLHRSGARAVCAYCERLPDGGYRLQFKPVDQAIYDEDMDSSLAGLNRSVEVCVRECPEQYQWEYRRFKFFPDFRRRYYW